MLHMIRRMIPCSMLVAASILGIFVAGQFVSPFCWLGHCLPDTPYHAADKGLQKLTMHAQSNGWNYERENTQRDSSPLEFYKGWLEFNDAGAPHDPKRCQNF